MLDINHDYSDLISQFNEACQLLKKKDVSFEDRVCASNTFFSLLSSYEKIMHYEFGAKEIEGMISPDIIDYFDQNDLERYYQFLKDKRWHTDVFYHAYDELRSEMDGFDFSLLADMDDSFDCHKDKTLLSQYFSSYSDLDGVYHNLLLSGRIYPLNDFSHEVGGLTCFNLLRKCCNVFVNEVNTSFTDLSGVPHELGHGVDFQDGICNCSSLGQSRFLSFDFFREVLSNYYEQQFLFYFLENGPYQDKAYLALIQYYDKYLKLLQESFYLSSLPHESLEEKIRDTLPLFMIEKELVYDGMLDQSEMTMDDRLVDFDVSVMYSYGFLLSTYLLEHPESFANFMKIKNQPFSIEHLQDIGVTTDSLVKSLRRRSRRVFSLNNH